MMNFLKHMWISILAGALFLLLGVGQVYAEDTEDSIKLSVKVSGDLKAKYVYVYARKPHGGNLKHIVCEVPCELTFKMSEPFHILVPTFKKQNSYGKTRYFNYETNIRRNHDDAIVKDGVYYFDIQIGNPLEEAQRYYRYVASEQNNNPKRLACYDFSIDQLSERATPCFKNIAAMPANVKRSGWCELTFIVKTDGSTDDVKAGECSEEMFRTTSAESAKLYRYYPRVKDGKLATVRIKTKVHFTYINQKGKRVRAKGEKRKKG